MNSIVPMVLTASGLLFAAIGVGLLLTVDALLGAIFIAVGASDAIVAMIVRRRSEGGGTSPNPYARED
jgi:hypothetical protein